MKKDIKNVAVTFSLIACMLYGGSFIYSEKVTADESREKRALAQEQSALEAQEAMQIQLLKINSEQERQLALQVAQTEQVQETQEVIPSKKPVVQKPEVPVAKVTSATTQQATDIAAQQAALARQKEADALLAKQIADAKAAAAKVAQQKADAAAAKVATAKASRKSRAS